jgi:GGDEF domain-containing protein
MSLIQFGLKHDRPRGAAVGFFATLTRKTSAGGPEARWELSECVRANLPRRFEAVGEALASGSGSLDACEVAGRKLSQDGASLDEVLGGLLSTTRAVTGGDPTYADIRAIAVAWSESTLAYLHQLSCEDPLTGLASLGHVRSRLSELYRGQFRGDTRLQDTHALVVADLPHDRPGHEQGDGDSFSRAMRLVRLSEAARTVFSGAESIGRMGTNRIVVVVDRDAQLGRRVAIMRKMLSMVGYPTRVWIEGLPGTDAGAANLLDELARP